MIPARKSAPFNFVARRWLERTLRRRFHGVYVFGAEHLRALDPQTGFVGCVNHTNWWDGFVLYIVSWKMLPHDIYLAMEEKNLRRYRFFTRMGVFGIDLAARSSVLPGVRYALNLLRPGRLIWMFVQGELLSASVPVQIKPGAQFLARRTKAGLLPVVLRYEWLNESRPSILISVGAPLLASTPATELADVLNGMYACLGRNVESLDFTGGEMLFPPRMSINKRWDYLRNLLRLRREPFDVQNR